MTRKTIFASIAALLATTSACGQPERLATAGDFCATDRRISAEPHPRDPAEGPQSDPANQFDTELTVADILAHNQRYDAVCGTD